jgi:TrkA domain protein
VKVVAVVVVFYPPSTARCGMDVTETDLPGVGKRFEVDVGDGETAVVLVHNTGRRELFVRPDPEADAEKLLDLSDREARVLGSILEGAHFQPVRTDVTETTIGENGIMLEWYTLSGDDTLAGTSIGSVDVRQRTGATIAAIERAGEVVQSPGPEFVFEPGDRLVVVGSRETLAAFAEELL